MSEERLTVAELMARAAKEGHSTDAPRRRRRRSLEDGGVSVAELTGSIPAVKEKPAESRHSAVKIDDPVQPSAPKTPQTPKAEDSASAPEPAVAPEAPVKVPKIAKDPAKTPEVAGATGTTGAAKAKAEPKVDPEAELKTKPQAQPKAEVAPKAAPEAPTKPVAPAKKTAPAAPVTPTQSAKPTAVVEPVAPVKPVVSATTPKVKESAPEKGAQQDKPAPVRSAPSEDETMVLSIVDEKDPIRLTTGAFPVVPASAVKPAQVQQTPANTQDAEAAADAEFATTGSEGRAGESPADTTQLDTTTGELEATDGAEDDQDQESGKVSVFSVLLMAVVGVVLGAAVFLAFEMLWERLNNWLVGILAIAVTLGMVGIVHALRTSRDGFSMVLAGVVGLVMTFGPLLIVF